MTSVSKYSTFIADYEMSGPIFETMMANLVARGMAVPKDTPEDVTRKLSDIFGQINENPEFREKMQDLGFVLIDVPYAEVDEFMAERREEYEEVAREMGIIE